MTPETDLTVLRFQRGNSRPWSERVVRSWCFFAPWPVVDYQDLGVLLWGFLSWMGDNYGDPGLLHEGPAWCFRLRSRWSDHDPGGIDIFFTEQHDAARFALFFLSER